MKYPNNNMITWNRLAVHICQNSQLVLSTLLCSVVTINLFGQCREDNTYKLMKYVPDYVCDRKVSRCCDCVLRAVVEATK